MSDWEIVPDAPAPAAAPSGGGGEWSVVPDGEASAPAPQPKSFFARAAEGIAHGVHAIGNVAADQAKTLAYEYSHPIDAIATPEGRQKVIEGSLLTNPAKRREFERGVGDVVTLGYANKAAEAVDRATGENKMSPEQQARDAEEAPEYRAGGQVVGSFLPNPISKAAGALGTVASSAAGRAAPAAVAAIGRVASKVPAPLAGAAKNLAGYEATAPVSAALSADAEGHRLEAAKQAATDPTGLVLSGATGVASGVAQTLTRRLATAQQKAPEVQQAARTRAVKDLGEEITNPAGVSARATDKRRVAEVNDRLYDLAEQNPELRHAFGEPAEKALPKLAAFKAKIAEPLDRLYDAIDQQTGGGIKLSTVTQSLRDQADQLGKRVSGLDDAARLRKLADRFDEAYMPKEGATTPGAEPRPLAHGEPPLVHDEKFYQDALDEFNDIPPTRVEGGGSHATRGGATVAGARTLPPAGGTRATVASPAARTQLADLKKLRENAKGVSADAIDQEIAKLEAHAPERAGDVVIPTKEFRHEVTDLLKTSESVMGGLEGTPRHEALSKLYDAGKAILDKHIDGSGLPAPDIAQIRDINNGYFLVSRAESAIESRGWKEANRPGFQIAHGTKQALHAGGLTAAGYAATHPHAIPTMAAYAAGAAVIPKAIKAGNLSIARGSYGRAVDRLARIARVTPNPSDFIAQAVRAGMGPVAARRIYEAAHQGDQQGASP